MPTPYPVAFEIFGLEIMWYAIFVTSGIVIATLITYFRAPKHGISQDTLLNMVLISVPIGIIGARAYYVLFNWSSYAGDIVKILNFRGGGLAIYGGVIAGVVTTIAFARHRRMNVLTMLDTASTGLVVGQVIGRWGNFFNREAFGGYTDNLLAMQIPRGMVRSDEVTQAMREDG